MAQDEDLPAPSRTGTWYGDGLCFSCKPDCGACCTNHDDYAYVYLDRGDVPRMVEHLGIEEHEFLSRYTTVDDGFIVLRMDHPECPFLRGTRCTIYPVRPVQCRTFPFWGENLTDPAAWRRLRSFCPGVDRGPKVPLAEIEAHAERARSLDPAEES